MNHCTIFLLHRSNSLFYYPIFIGNFTLRNNESKVLYPYKIRYCS